MESGMFINYVLGLLLRRIVVPTEFHEQTQAVKDMQKDDVSGLVDSLTDFAVDSASVDFRIETDNNKFSETLKKWLNEINKGYNGKIPSGIKPLAKEYFKERWKNSSFPILKVGGWDKINGVNLPSKMYFVDGGSIYAKDKHEDDEALHLINYDYFIGRETKDSNKLDKGCIFAKPYGRWFNKYPTPYLIKRGVYHNWKLIQSLKNKESEILDQIIPYLLMIKKGSAELEIQKDITYSPDELKAVIKEFQDLIDKVKSTTPSETGNVKAPIRATNFDEEIKHLIPDLECIFKPTLFAVAEKNILTGLGFIDIAEAVSSSRRESILNPKVFIKEVESGVEGFRQILKELMFLIKTKNKNHTKYNNVDFYITASPITSFMTDDFKEKIRQLYDRGLISKQTTVELVGEVDFRTEIHRRKEETKKGLDLEMYPPLRENVEDKGLDIPGEEPAKPKDTDDEDISDDKKDKIEKENYRVAKYEAPAKCPECGNTFDMLAETEVSMGAVACPKCGQKVTQKNLIKSKKEANLETAPYNTTKDLPARVKNSLDTDLQGVFMRVFNNAYRQYKNDTRAFRVAWSVIKQIGRKGKDGKWHRKRKRVKGKLRKMRLSRAMLEEILEKEEKQAIDETMTLKKLENEEKRGQLLDKLLGKKKE